MKNQKKKGTAPRRKQHPTNQNHFNRIENICLVFAVTFLILFIGGNFLNNEPMIYLGAGIGLAGMLLQVDINFSEEDEDIWEE